MHRRGIYTFATPSGIRSLSRKKCLSFHVASTTETLFFGNRNSLLCPTMEVSNIGGPPLPDGPLCRLSSPSWGTHHPEDFWRWHVTGVFLIQPVFDAPSDLEYRGAVYNSGRKVVQQIANNGMSAFCCEKCVKWDWIYVIYNQISSKCWIIDLSFVWGQTLPLVIQTQLEFQFPSENLPLKTNVVNITSRFLLSFTNPAKITSFLSLLSWWR